jgi:hypothetical protein
MAHGGRSLPIVLNSTLVPAALPLPTLCSYWQRFTRHLTGHKDTLAVALAATAFVFEAGAFLSYPAVSQCCLI